MPAQAPAPAVGAAAGPLAAPVSEPTSAPAPSDAAPAEAPAASDSAPTATIELHFVHRIKSGSLEVWIDGERAWSTPLASPKNPLRRIGGEELIGFIEIPAGRREIEVRVANAAESIDAREAVSVELTAGETRLLRAVLPPMRSRLRLKWEP
jgi:hypothetical protein